MGGSANDSSLTPFLPPSPNFVSAVHAPPVPVIDVTCDIVMDQTVTPALTSLEIVLDGVPETPGGFVWTGPTVFQIIASAPAVSTLVVNLLTLDSNLRSLAGSFMRAPQSVIGFP